MRSLEKGDKAIVLLPTEVVEKVGINEYRISIRDNHSLFHINMMKKYYERNDDYVMGLSGINPNVKITRILPVVGGRNVFGMST